MSDFDGEAERMGQSARPAILGRALAGLFALLRRQFWIIVLVAGVGTLAVLAYGNIQVPVYEATAVVQVRGHDVDFQSIEARLTRRENLIAMATRHRLFGMTPQDMGEGSAVQVRQAFAMHEMTSEAGQALGLAPELSGIVLSVRLGDAELAARVANDLALQVLALGKNGQLDPSHDRLMFYRGEEVRLWQEVSALRGEIDASAKSGSLTEADALIGAGHKLALMQDQYDLVRRELAMQEVAGRLALRDRDGQFGLLQRATSAQALNVVGNWMLSGVAGSLLLAVTLAFVLERRFPLAQERIWQRLAGPRRASARLYRHFDDPGRPIFGVPRFAVIAVLVVGVLVGISHLLR